jgi:dihydroxyacetone kinase
LVLAAQLASAEGIEVHKIRISDYVASASKAESAKRREKVNSSR